jgi:hypothetical protein
MQLKKDTKTNYMENYNIDWKVFYEDMKQDQLKRQKAEMIPESKYKQKIFFEVMVH